MNNEHHHHHHKKHSLKSWIKDNSRLLIVVSVLLIFFVVGTYFDIKEEVVTDEEIAEYMQEQYENYEGIITIIDGEGEETFSKVWGELIEEGYPICSNLVTSYVGTEGYYDWDTIKSLNEVGIEFIYHSMDHSSYNEKTNEDIINEIISDKTILCEHGLDNKYIVWLGNTNINVIKLGNNYFSCDFAMNDSSISYDQIEGRKPIKYYYRESSYSFPELQQYIDYAIKNNEWIVLFTRNTFDFMNDEQINIFRRTFEYAKEHNVGIVGVQEGFDLYYANKLGND